jgi:hypothetical protein
MYLHICTTDSPAHALKQTTPSVPSKLLTENTAAAYERVYLLSVASLPRLLVLAFEIIHC